MNHPFLKFTKNATLLLAVAFCLHLVILKGLQAPLFDNQIIASYIVNLGLIVTIFGFLFVFRDRLKNQLGFLFIGGSVLKFAVFFMFFYPGYKADGAISKFEFAAFFVPYAIGLILETISLSKWLNKLD